ncbi:TauD/TfdA family dioxygenase [Ramlibacter henchirensis]|uniref:TauD/TfdA family dioxygenase n=1 Tax=Ramlibacter henchirensis TaxID=204072 RepID=A0A4Z0BX91_9BURK|nr:TauD/TfdA family dioxygenase [Ramlibacter henchirensis]TFZ02950.1 TauD/TfdA family dioxygenase [Ramlibacter henchirensis]
MQTAAPDSPNVRVQPIKGEFVASVEGLDLRNTLSNEQAAWVEKTLAAHGVLIFRDQRIGDVEQLNFIKLFGPPKAASFSETQTEVRYLIDVTNADAEGNILPMTDKGAMFMRSNQQWHSDGTYNPLPHRITTLHARELPHNAPPTEYADMRGAWEALSGQRQSELQGLVVQHDRSWSLLQAGMTPEQLTEEHKSRTAPQPLVRVNKITGRKSLYLASHASHIVGWPVEEGRKLLKELIEHATQPQFVYTHMWQARDLVLWDDAATMHRAVPYKDRLVRRMKQGGAHEVAPLLQGA